MKQLLLILLSCIVISTAHAQNNYVEVTVNDTVQVKADYFVFRVMINPDNDYNNADTAGMRTDPMGYYRKIETKRQERQKDAFKAMETKLKNEGFSVEPLTLGDFAYRNSLTNFLLISTRSVDRLNTLNEMVKTEKGLNLQLTQITSSQEDAAVLRLQQKLMAKAKTKAAELAKLTGKKISGIISVSDRRNDQAPYLQNNISQVTALGVERVNVPGEKINASYPMTGALVVRFSWL
jgi:hypothetical protein